MFTIDFITVIWVFRRLELGFDALYKMLKEHYDTKIYYKIIVKENRKRRDTVDLAAVE